MKVVVNMNEVFTISNANYRRLLSLIAKDEDGAGEFLLKNGRSIGLIDANITSMSIDEAKEKLRD